MAATLCILARGRWQRRLVEIVVLVIHKLLLSIFWDRRHIATLPGLLRTIPKDRRKVQYLVDVGVRLWITAEPF